MIPSIDPIGLLSALAGVLPGGARYLPLLAAYASLLGGICVALTIVVPAPTTLSPRWWLTTYRVISFLAGNFGRAANAVPPGLSPAVHDLAAANAALTAQEPGLAIVHETRSGASVVLPLPAPL